MISFALALAAGVLAIPILVFALEIVVAVLRVSRADAPQPSGVRARLAVLVPAHNESQSLLPTLANIRQQLLPGDRLLVVADNCSDDTAAIASAACAEVVERRDAARRGKGFALDFGVRHLAASTPEVVIIVDADCHVGDGAIDHLARAATATGRPVQALYLMNAPVGINHRVAAFAWRVKNKLRPLGLAALGLPCQLVGTGMAFPWNLIRSADLANGWLVEDLKLGLDLAAAGHPPLFCPAALVTSEFATSAAGAQSQRTRWEHGHLRTISELVPPLVGQALRRRDWPLLALALDLAVPPLSLLALLVAGMFFVTVAAALLGVSPTAQAIASANVLLFALAVLLAWFRCGRDVLPARALISTVPYVLGKLGLYRRALSRTGQSEWIRTDRTKSE